jgi:lipopolysaccharide transport system ATP-binding protein
VLFVSHNMAMIENLCERCLVLHEGRLTWEGPSRSAIEHYIQDLFMAVSPVPLAERQDRQGTGRVRLIDVRLLDLHLRPTGSAVSGQRCHLDFYFDAPEPVPNISIAFTVRDERSQYLFRPCSEDVGFLPERCPQKGILRCSIPRLPLAPGNYRITVEIRVNNSIADYIEGVFVLTVEGGDFFGTGRMNCHSPVLLDHLWEIAN